MLNSDYYLIGELLLISPFNEDETILKRVTIRDILIN